MRLKIEGFDQLFFSGLHNDVQVFIIQNTDLTLGQDNKRVFELYTKRCCEYVDRVLLTIL